MVKLFHSYIGKGRKETRRYIRRGYVFESILYFISYFFLLPAGVIIAIVLSIYGLVVLALFTGIWGPIAIVCTILLVTGYGALWYYLIREN